MKGGVTLRIEGMMLERLLERAQSEGAVFRSVRREEGYAAVIQADANSGQILERLCERFSISCRIVARHGQDAMFRRLKERATLLAGMIVGLCAAALLLSRIWMIDIVTGDNAVNSSSIRNYLEAQGICVGMPVSRVDPEAVENAMLADFTEFSFINVRLQGIRLLVEIVPVVTEPEIYRLELRRDLVARCGGVVADVKVLSGVACVKPGDTVFEGQLLILGDERIGADETRDVAALGSVIARTWQVGAAQAPVEQTITERTGRSSSSVQLKLPWAVWTLSEGESYGLQEVRKEILPVGGLFLPLEIHRTTAYELTQRSEPLDQAVLKEWLAVLATADAAVQAAECHGKDFESVGSHVDYSIDAEGVMHARVVCETLTDVAVVRDERY